MMLPKQRMVVLLCALFSFLLFTGQGMAAETKIGFVSVQQVLFGCKIGEDARKQLMEKDQTLKSDLNVIIESGKALEAEIIKKQSVWPPEKFREKQRELQTIAHKAKMKEEDAKYEMTELRKKLLSPIVAKLDPIMKEYGKANGYTMIIDADVAARSGLIVYGEPSLDVTKELVEKLNEKL